MNYIFTNNKNHRSYVLDPEINMGSKVCLVDMITCENKFLAVSTLKRNYSKQMVEETIIELKAFTGMNIGMFKMYPINGVWNIRTKSGKWLEFNAEGIQINAKNPKYANKLGMDYSFQESTLDWALS